MTMKQKHNPYNFANPVSDKEIFAGREKELDEIKYYLDHAISAPNPINIALLGQRAAGKTSFLNMTEAEAKERGFCTVRINLDEGDVRSELSFFFKIIDNIIYEACNDGAFGGLHDEVFQTYQDIVTTFEIPKEKLFMVFNFPTQYARAMGSGNKALAVSDAMYRRDLEKIRQELDKPVVLLFDECNVLGDQKIILEKLRNIFMNNPGYMLVLTGTPDLFPIMDDVFSPIIRQFKKINLGEFESVKDTRNCILNPLSRYDLNPFEVMDTEFFDDVSSVHSITGGRPYEIQLVCHILFRQVQSGRSDRMKFNLRVLEDIRKELEQSQSVSRQDFITTILQLSDVELESISLLCDFNGAATFDESWGLLRTLQLVSENDRSHLTASLEALRKKGVISVSSEGLVQFAGDEFARMYLKYYSRERQYSLSFISTSFRSHVQRKILDYIAESFGTLAFSSFIYRRGEEGPIELLNRLKVNPKDIEALKQMRGAIDSLYPLIFRYRNGEPTQAVKIELTTPWAHLVIWCLANNVDKNGRIPDTFLGSLNQLNNSGNTYGYVVDASIIDFSTPNFESVFETIENSDDDYMKFETAFWHKRQVGEVYGRCKEPELPLLHISYTKRLEREDTADTLINLGYLLIKKQEFSDAKVALEKAIELSSSDEEKALSIYNLGVAEFSSGNYSKAKGNIARGCLGNRVGLFQLLRWSNDSLKRPYTSASLS